MSGREPLARGALRAAALALLALALGGCVESALIEKYARKPDYSPAPPPEAVPLTDGAIYPGVVPSGSFLFFDRKARGLGDLVTVVIVERATAASDAKTDLERKSSIGATASSDISLQNLVAVPIEWMLDLFGLANDTDKQPDGTTVDLLTADTTTRYEGDGNTERSGRLSAVITCRVIDVLPGDTFLIRGRRSVIVNHEEQFITVEGLVRREDILIDNTVPSTKLAEARLTYDGIGVVDDKQRPGLVQRMMDWVHPF